MRTSLKVVRPSSPSVSPPVSPLVSRRVTKRTSTMEWEAQGIAPSPKQNLKTPSPVCWEEGSELHPPDVETRPPSPFEDDPEVVQKRVWLFHPLQRFRTVWDLVTLMLLVYVGAVTPVSISFFDKPSVSFSIFDHVVDIFFGFDVCINFFTMYYSRERQVYVTNYRPVALHYLQTWFFVDLVTVIPFDVLAELGGTGGDNLQLLRVVKLVKLVKLVRVLRLGRIVGRWESRLGIRYGVLKLYKFLGIILIVAHWSACLWHLVATTEEATTPDFVTPVTWLERVRQRDQVEVLSVFDRYTVSFYWSVMTLTTIGYGDIVPATTAERWVSIFSQLTGACVFAYIVGNVTTLVASLNRNEEAYQQQMDSLNEYIKVQRLPEDLKLRLRDYFAAAIPHAHTFDYGLLNLMSPTLRGEVVAWSLKDIVAKIPLFRGTDIDFVTAIAVNFRPETFAPDEYFFKEGDVCEKLYVINTGTVHILSAAGNTVQTLRDGAVFGEDLLLAKVRRYSAVAVSYVNVSTILNTAVASVLEKRPEILMRMKSVHSQRLWKKGYTKAKAINAIFRPIVSRRRESVRPMQQGDERQLQIRVTQALESRPPHVSVPHLYYNDDVPTPDHDPLEPDNRPSLYSARTTNNDDDGSGSSRKPGYTHVNSGDTAHSNDTHNNSTHNNNTHHSHSNNNDESSSSRKPIRVNSGDSDTAPNNNAHNHNSNNSSNNGNGSSSSSSRRKPSHIRVNSDTDAAGSHNDSSFAPVRSRSLSVTPTLDRTSLADTLDPQRKLSDTPSRRRGSHLDTPDFQRSSPDRHRSAHLDTPDFQRSSPDRHRSAHSDTAETQRSDAQGRRLVHGQGAQRRHEMGAPATSPVLPPRLDSFAGTGEPSETQYLRDEVTRLRLLLYGSASAAEASAWPMPPSPSNLPTDSLASEASTVPATHNTTTTHTADASKQSQQQQQQPKGTYVSCPSPISFGGSHAQAAPAATSTRFSVAQIHHDVQTLQQQNQRIERKLDLLLAAQPGILPSLAAYADAYDDDDDRSSFGSTFHLNAPHTPE